MPETKVPSYRLHRASGQAVVTLAGKDHYLGKYGTEESRRSYNELLGRWLANQRALSNESTDWSVAEVTVRYWEFAETYYTKLGRPNTEAANIKSALRPLVSLYGSTPAATFGPLKLKIVRQAMVNNGCSRSHTNKQVARIKRMFKWAVENELVPPTVFHGLQAIAGLKRGRCDARETEPVRPVPDHFVDAIRPHVGRQVWAMAHHGK